MSRLITDLLEYSRIPTCGRPPKPVAVETVLAQALKNLQVSIAETGASITHDPLPTICGDGPQLVQLLQNLIGNAIKFRHPEHASRIHVSAERKGQEWVFSVRDNGIGIDPQYAERIFLIFQRLHSRKLVSRDGNRPGDLQTDRGAAWRAGLGGKQSGPRLDVFLYDRCVTPKSWVVDAAANQ